MIYPNNNINLIRKITQISLNLNIMKLPIGLSVSTLFMLSSSPSFSLGFLAQLASLLPTTSGGICWWCSCLEFVCQLIFWFSMLSHLVCLERLELLSLPLLHFCPWLRIQPFLWRKFGLKGNVSNCCNYTSNISFLFFLAGKIHEVLKNSWSKHYSLTYNEKYEFGTCMPF